MKLPDLSNMMSVGQLRHIQANYETPEYYNPDMLVEKFLSPQQKLTCTIRGKLLKSRLRANPFYHYILARTKYYDQIFFDAICGSTTCIINIGCGSDTRAYRFAHILQQKGMSVIECDQPQTIYVKQEVAQQNWPTEHVKYLPLDLNSFEWPAFSELLDEKCQKPALVIMEGVSPYIISESFKAFLSLLADKLNDHSQLAYDFKIAGTLDNFGKSAEVKQPFRLPLDLKDVSAYHNALGFQVQHMESSTELTKRLLPSARLFFDEDCLLRLTPVSQRRHEN